MKTLQANTANMAAVSQWHTTELAANRATAPLPCACAILATLTSQTALTAMHIIAYRLCLGPGSNIHVHRYLLLLPNYLMHHCPPVAKMHANCIAGLAALRETSAVMVGNKVSRFSDTCTQSIKSVVSTECESLNGISKPAGKHTPQAHSNVVSTAVAEITSAAAAAAGSEASYDPTGQLQLLLVVVLLLRLTCPPHQ
jgi:hypothetical protein